MSDVVNIVQNTVLNVSSELATTSKSTEYHEKVFENSLYQESPGPLGLSTLCDVCQKLYPDQPNPLQVTARLKYWLGGPDPLDYISMYWNKGDPQLNVSPHWHYISFGLSDLHGDGRVHPPPDKVLLENDSKQVQSGFGLELTFRLKSESMTPETWPAALLQHLARYIFRTGNRLCVGDHITWHTGLNNDSTSRIKHMLVAAEPQLEITDTPHGTVQFMQIVGCTNKEVRAAQRSSGANVLEIMSRDSSCGGKWLVTDMERKKSASGLEEALNIARIPNDLAGVSAPIKYLEWFSSVSNSEEKKLLEVKPKDTKMSTESFTNNNGHNTYTACTSAAMSTDSFEMSSVCAALRQVIANSVNDPLLETIEGHLENSTDSKSDSHDIVYMKGVHIFFNSEGANLIPLALKGRLIHGRHFTWRGDACAVTLVTRQTRDAFVTQTKPYGHTRDHWLQVYIPDWLSQDMIEKTNIFENSSYSDSEDENSTSKSKPALPITLAWPELNFKITILEELD